MANQHVVKRGSHWAVRGEGNGRDTSLHPTQREAIASAREIARNQRSELVIHDTSGKIKARDTHGRDPYPPKG